ncbi:hypothetical protein KTT_45170 [Tengunoibacter tsumagoiensis]|uniref:Uncharacterized protein n=1 Tax=Tengunoibacter tsumagoiensis TaxID=2014871 RepID=A0A402A699_9CHLR|nr:hypothetical protein KTT_45170 [Tengunoibacter tsumagoiensis]
MFSYLIKKRQGLAMIILLTSLGLLLLLDIAALRWGVDSRDSIESNEWEHRLEQVRKQLSEAC